MNSFVLKFLETFIDAQFLVQIHQISAIGAISQ